MKLLVSPQGPRSRKWSQSWRFLGHIVVCSIFLAATVAFAWPGQAQNTTQPTAQGETPGQGQVTGRSRGRGIQPDREHPILAIGAPAPDFSLPGIDGKNHTLGEYANAKILAVVFESNHCPVSIAYEDRIRQIREDYKNEGVALIAINANNASAVRLNELGYTDMTDDMKDMKTRQHSGTSTGPIYMTVKLRPPRRSSELWRHRTCSSSMRTANFDTRAELMTARAWRMSNRMMLARRSMPWWPASQFPLR